MDNIEFHKKIFRSCNRLKYILITASYAARICSNTANIISIKYQKYKYCKYWFLNNVMLARSI